MKVVVCAKVEPGEAEAVRHAAERAGISISAWLRSLVVKAFEEVGQ